MELSSDLISEFVKATKPETPPPKDTTAYGTVRYDGKMYVKLDGSDLLTPVSSTTDAVNGDRVVVTFKDHKAVVTGNLSSPSARTDTVKEQISGVNNSISEFGTVVAHKVTANDLKAIHATIGSLTAITGKYESLEVLTADITKLQAKFIEGESIKANDIIAVMAELDKIKATFGDFEEVTTEDLKAFNTEIVNLKARTAEFTYISANKATVDELKVGKADIDLANINEAAIQKLGVNFANIDFANIGEAAIRKIFSDSGLIKDLVVGDQTITGELVGVTIKGDLIEGNTVVADKLVIKGDDGLYYKLNFESGNFTSAEEVPTDSLHGSVITANSITAEKVSVDDLVAFDATIGGFNITKNSIHSFGKASVDNSNVGMYLDNEGQVAFGDSDHYLKYYIYQEATSTISEDIIYLSEDKADMFNVSIAGDVLYITGGLDYTPSTDVYIVNQTLVARNDSYRLEISADSIMFGRDSKSSASDLKALTEHIKIGNVYDEEFDDEKPCIEMSEGDSDFRQVITNVKTMFMDGPKPTTTIGTRGVSTEKLTVNTEFEQKSQNGSFMWAARSNGNYGLSWKGVTS